MDCISFPVQAAGRTRASGILCSVPASLRLEFVVRVAGLVARLPVGCAHRRTIARGQPECAVAIPRRSIPWQATFDGPHGDLAVLVHRYRYEAKDWRMVATPGHRPLHRDGNARA